ncbi:hypothetical protein HOLleu_18599 [Holothuria leucospilota]|uniref:TIR domain-containing protein n=1 Tax=Holothuria leucospilota TaxID=206669 RepID=A0A9Q1H9S6_HOLLE|nr:hypothetical protein HOLleu_18599 [Holothuria leucospilota]
MSQLLCLKDNELDLLAGYMGHDIRIHREFYRLPESTLQLAKVSKVLIMMEKGITSDYKGKSLDEINIPLDESDVADEDATDAGDENVGDYSKDNNQETCEDMNIQDLNKCLLVPLNPFLQEVKLEFDIYLSYSEADKSIVEKIQEKLKKNEDVRIFSTRQQLDEDSFWQEDMYEVMMKSARVITVLTPNYLQTTACLEQYNIALCCNRKAHRDMLAPFYAITIENMPTYMGLVQYVDCRSQDAESINNACYQIIISLSINFTRSLSVMNASVVQYDLFLSYCHKDTEIAQRIVKMLRDMNSHLKIFFDVQELKTGKSWQRALYHSIDGSRCLVALMTNSYIKSAVCQEEFNLAMMKHYAKTNHLQLIPFVIEEVSHLPPGFEKIPQITTNAETLEDDISTLCSSLVTWLDTGAISEDSTYHKYFVNPKDMKIHISEKWETLRRNHFEEKFYNAQHTLSTSDFPPIVTDAFKKGKKPSANDESCDFVLSYNEHDKMYADYIMKLFQHFAPKLNIQAKGKNEQERLTRIEEGKKIVPLLSPSYIESPEQVEELHVAIWRSRLSPNLIFPIHLHTLPSRPAYFHLLPCAVNLNDSLWAELALKKKKLVLPDEVEKAVDGLSKKSEELALYMAAYYLLETIERERHEATPQSSSSSPKPALLNPFCLDRNIKDLSSDDYGQVPNTNTSHSGIADNAMDSTSELTSNAAIDKAEDKVSDTNKSHTETDGTSELTSNTAIDKAEDEVSHTNKSHTEIDGTSELTSNAAIDKAEDEVSHTNKSHTETDGTSELTSNAAIDKAEDEVSHTNKSHTETDDTSELTSNAATDKPKDEVSDTSKLQSDTGATSEQHSNAAVEKAEDETNNSNKPLPVAEITEEEKNVTMTLAKEDTGQDLVVRKDDNKTTEPYSGQKSPDEDSNVERQQNSSSSKLNRASGHEKEKSLEKKSESRMCNLI